MNSVRLWQRKNNKILDLFPALSLVFYLLRCEGTFHLYSHNKTCQIVYIKVEGKSRKLKMSYTVGHLFSLY